MFLRALAMLYLRSLVALLFFSSSKLFAGSSSAIIKGKTRTGRTHLEIHFQDISADITYVRLSIDNHV